MKVLEDHKADGIRHREFVVDGASHPIPGALWTPVTEPATADGGSPLVLIGHGASGDKYQDYVRSLGRRLARDFGVAAAAIDGPVHGGRREDGGLDGQRAFLDFATLWSSDDGMTDRMVDDWRRSLDALLELPGISGPVGYWGLSMGTILGLPYVAAEPRVSVAVLGLMGVTGPTADRIRADAAAIERPVLYLVQWSDELFPRDTAFELFDLLASTDKTLHANPGSHGAVPDHEFAASARYLVRHLAG